MQQLFKDYVIAKYGIEYVNSYSSHLEESLFNYLDGVYNPSEPEKNVFCSYSKPSKNKRIGKAKQKYINKLFKQLRFVNPIPLNPSLITFETYLRSLEKDV